MKLSFGASVGSFSCFVTRTVVCGVAWCLLSGSGVAQDAKEQTESAFLIQPPFAWNRTDVYQAPNFGAFFPNDAEAGKRLDAMIEGKIKPDSTEQRLAWVRQGLRNTKHHRTTLLGKVGNQYIWNRDPQHDAAIELMYQASDSDDHEISHYAMYHGPTVVANRTENLIRMLMEKYQTLDQGMQRRIAWGMGRYGDKEVTRQLLIDYLEDPSKTSDDGIAAALDIYHEVFGERVENTEQFADVGLWVIAFHRDDVSSDHPRASDILREMILKPLRGQEDRLVDFATRDHRGKEVAVALIKGAGTRDLVVDRFETYRGFEIDFNEYLSPRVLQQRRLREFAKHLPDGLPDRARPAYTRPPLDQSYAHLAREYVAPDFEAYFADDPGAGERLDKLYEDRDSIEISDAQLLEAFRRGIRHSKHRPNVMFGWISSALGWPHDPRLTEILYQAMDVEAPEQMRKYANYFGFGLGTIKTDNILEVMYRSYMAPPFDSVTNQNMRPRILWGVRDHEDDKHALAMRFESALREHKELSIDQLYVADQAYRQLTGKAPSQEKEYESRMTYVVVLGGRDAKDLESFERTLRERFISLPNFLDVAVMKQGNDIYGVCIVRGRSGVDTLIENFEQQPKLTAYALVPLTKSYIDSAKVESFKAFEKYLSQ